MVTHACNPTTWEVETGGPQVCSQPQQLSQALHNLVRLCFKIKNKIELGCSSEVECPWVQSQYHKKKSKSKGKHSYQ